MLKCVTEQSQDITHVRDCIPQDFIASLHAALSPAFLKDTQGELVILGLRRVHKVPRLWFTREKQCYGVSIEYDAHALSHRALHLVLAAVPGAAEAPKTEVAESTTEVVYLLCDERGVARGTIGIVIDGAALSSVSKTIEESSSICALSIRAHIPLSLTTNQFECRWPFSVLLESPHTGRVWEGTMHYAPHLQHARVSIIQRRNNMSHAQSTIENDAMVLMLELGAIEVPLREYLALRVGTSFALSIGANTKGLLRCGGEPFAEVAIRLEPTGLIAEITSVLQIPHTQLSLQTVDN